MSPPKDSRPDNYEMNAKICRLVEQCPFMYDRSHPQYLRKEVCDEAWVRIAKEMGESVFPCRERWRNIRTSFARSINTNKVPSSANRTKPYYLHEELKFLARHITPGVPVRRKRATSGSGEESEHIEVSVGEETFNGFERLSTIGGESSDTQNGHDNSWQRLQQHIHDNMGTGGIVSGGGSDGGGVGGGDGASGVGIGVGVGVGVGRNSVNIGDDTGLIENDSCNSSLNGREVDPTCSRFARLPPPPLQAAPHNTLQRAVDETEAVGSLQQIRTLCPPLSKRPRKRSDPINTDQASGPDFVDDDERHRLRNTANVEASFLLELQSELEDMNHRQKIHLKRRIYEALSEIYPLTTEHTGILPKQPKSESVGSIRSVPPAFGNGPTVQDIDNPIVETPTVPQPIPVSAPPKRNGMGLRTRQALRPAERSKQMPANIAHNGPAVKDEPEMTE